MRYEFHPEAEQELSVAALRYESEVAGLGLRFGVEVNLAIATGTISPSAAYIAVSGIDAHHDRIVRCGGRIAVPIGERPYGMRDFSVCDPAGNELSFGEALASTRE